MLLYISIIVAGVILDQLTKQFAVIWLSGVATLPIIPNVLHLTYVENTGAAFSLFTNMRIFLIIVTLIFIFLLGYIFYILPKTKSYRLANLALSLMLSGAIGNFLDRLRLSYVVDFFDIRLIGFAIFNVADVLVVIGTGLLIYSLIKNHNLFSKVGQKSKSKKLFSEETKTIDETLVLDDDTQEENYISENVSLNTESTVSNIDITPVVKTELIQLPTKRSIEFEPTPPSFQDFIDEETIKIYEPKKRRKKGTESNTDIISVEEILAEIDPAEPVVIKKENRYSKKAEEYEELVKHSQENRDKKSKRSSGRNRYNDNVSSYEKSIQEFKDKERKKKIEQKEETWESFKNNYSTKDDDSQNYYPIHESETTARRIRNRKSKYSNMIDSYENLVNSNRNQSKKDHSYSVEEENTQEPDVIESQTVVEIEVEEEIDLKPVRRNRYSDSTDSYIESIKIASKKEYTKKNQSN